MIFDVSNAWGAAVFQLDPVLELKRVLSVCTDSMAVTQADSPCRVDEQGNLAVTTRKFKAVWPVFGDDRLRGPVLIHCYGEIVQ